MFKIATIVVATEANVEIVLRYKDKFAFDAAVTLVELGSTYITSFCCK
jgi:hypothetical protein